mmetsp:Transcript_38530/g.85782  ORF Transcript_38530/g.85782 Transcript_38530/m.85782 type:complete len:82 (-) Transcript_38530:97-342(-)
MNPRDVAPWMVGQNAWLVTPVVIRRISISSMSGDPETQRHLAHVHGATPWNKAAGSSAADVVKSFTWRRIWILNNLLTPSA